MRKNSRYFYRLGEGNSVETDVGTGQLTFRIPTVFQAAANPDTFEKGTYSIQLETQIASALYLDFLNNFWNLLDIFWNEY